MQLTKELVQRFVGGQMEIQNSGGGYIFRGEIESITVEGTDLKVRFAWLAKGEGFPPIPHKWVKEDKLDYATSLDMCTVSDIGPSGGEIGGDNRIAVNCQILGELSVLYPPNGSKLDPVRVEGLVLTRKQ